jgi:hypothetical protein
MCLCAKNLDTFNASSHHELNKKKTVYETAVLILPHGHASFYRTNWLHIMNLSPSWEAASRSATQEFPYTSWNPKVNYSVHNSPPLVPILSQIQSIPPHPISLIFILILSSYLHLGLPSGPFPSSFPTKILYAILFSQCVLYALPISTSFNATKSFYGCISTSLIIVEHHSAMSPIRCCASLSRDVLSVPEYHVYNLATTKGTRQRRWLRHYATSRKIAGLIPDEVTGFFQLT